MRATRNQIAWLGIQAALMALHIASMSLAFVSMNFTILMPELPFPSGIAIGAGPSLWHDSDL